MFKVLNCELPEQSSKLFYSSGQIGYVSVLSMTRNLDIIFVLALPNNYKIKI